MATDRIQFQGVDLPPDFSLPPYQNYTLQIRRSHRITVITPDGQIEIESSASNVGQVLSQTGLQLYSADYIDPPLETPINSDLTVVYRPARNLTITEAGNVFLIRSSQPTVGQVLSSAGMGLTGLDLSLPADSEALPINGQIKITRIKETVSVSEKHSPYITQYEYSVTQPAGEQKVIQPGEQGLTFVRIRTRYEDGAEASKIIEASLEIRKPKNRVIGLSTQLAVTTIDTPDGQFQYWKAAQMYTTSYSPCRSGTSKCSYGTASGLQVKHGIVALIPSLFNILSGSKVYIPGYGVGVIGDVGGGFPDGRLWIDLGYSDDDYQSWSGLHLVYFLAPAPASIPPGLN